MVEARLLLTLNMFEANSALALAKEKAPRIIRASLMQHLWLVYDRSLPRRVTSPPLCVHLPSSDLDVSIPANQLPV